VSQQSVAGVGEDKSLEDITAQDTVIHPGYGLRLEALDVLQLGGKRVEPSLSETLCQNTQYSDQTWDTPLNPVRIFVKTMAAVAHRDSYAGVQSNRETSHLSHSC